MLAMQNLFMLLLSVQKIPIQEAIMQLKTGKKSPESSSGWRDHVTTIFPLAPRRFHGSTTSSDCSRCPSGRLDPRWSLIVFGSNAAPNCYTNPHGHGHSLEIPGL